MESTCWTDVGIRYKYVPHKNDMNMLSLTVDHFVLSQRNSIRCENFRHNDIWYDTDLGSGEWEAEFRLKTSRAHVIQEWKARKKSRSHLTTWSLNVAVGLGGKWRWFRWAAECSLDCNYTTTLTFLPCFGSENAPRSVFWSWQTDDLIYSLSHLSQCSWYERAGTNGRVTVTFSMKSMVPLAGKRKTNADVLMFSFLTLWIDLRSGCDWSLLLMSLTRMSCSCQRVQVPYILCRSIIRLLLITVLHYWSRRIWLRTQTSRGKVQDLRANGKGEIHYQPQLPGVWHQ